MGKITIKPEREYLREVAAKLKEGVYAIPAFQRDFVWHSNQVIDLFDSISKGYPIGSIILWKPKKGEEPYAKDIISERISESEVAEYYILDGRQRTTAFFGCIYDWENKPEIYHLYYDLEQDSFTYKAKRKEKVSLCLVSHIFDTYKMLGLLQQVMQDIKDENTARQYIEKIKELNTILQQYEIGEMLIDNCTLEESSTVFSRINSKGTDISKVAMLQARTYKEKGSVLLSDSINRIINNLSAYGFGDLKSDDVLNCCYRYVGRNFYDNKVMDSLLNANLETIVPLLETDITKAVKFLNERCGVIDYRLLPYNRQLIALAAFFKEKPQATEDELKEMERWFFYTTYQQTFLNGSLGNVRSVFRRFDEYLQGKATTAIDYKKIEIDNQLDFKYSVSSAQSNFISLSQVLMRRREDEHTALEYCGEYRFHGSKPVNTFLLLTNIDRDMIKEYMAGPPYVGPLDIFLLDEDMLSDHIAGRESLYLHKRKRRIVELSKNLLDSLNLEYEDNSLTTDFDVEESISGLLSEFDDLNNEESRELCEILGNERQRHSVIYDVKDDGNGSFSIGYGSFSRTYTLNDAAARKLLQMISDRYCNGEDPMDYYSWLIAIDKD